MTTMTFAPAVPALDCLSCTRRGPGCQGCLLSRVVDTDHSDGLLDLDDQERVALEALVAGGLLPPLLAGSALVQAA